MGASFNPEGALPGLPDLPVPPAPAISFSDSGTPNQTAPVPPATGIAPVQLPGGGSFTPTFSANDPTMAVPGGPGSAMMGIPGLPFTGPAPSLSSDALPPNALPPGLSSGVGTLAGGGTGGVTGFGSSGDAVTAATDGSAAGTISPNSSGAGQVPPTQFDSAGNPIITPDQQPFMDPQFPATPGQFSPTTLAGTGTVGDFFQNLLNRIGDLFTRAFLVLLGVMLLGIAVWYFGARDVKQTIVRAAP